MSNNRDLLDITGVDPLSIQLSPDLFSLTKIIQILQTPPDLRKLSMMLVLYKATTNIQFFINLHEETPEAHLSLCQFMGYERKDPNDYLFRSGESGTKFYIILQGKVGVLIKVKHFNDETQTIEEVENCVNTLEEGMSFGELALIKDQPRAASIQCITECHLATLEKKDYMTILGNITLKKIDSLTAFLKELSVFKTCTMKFVQRLSYYFKSVKYLRNQSVYKQGDSSDYVYIVKQGEFKLEREVPIKQDKQLSLRKNGKPKQETNRERQPSTIKAEVAILGEGEVIGDSDVLSGTNRTHHCKCYSRYGEVLAISKADFLKRVNNPDSLAYLTRKNEILNNQHTERISKLEKIKERSFSPKPASSPQKTKNAVLKQVLDSVSPIKLYRRLPEMERLKQKIINLEKPSPSPTKRPITDSYKIFNSELYEKRIQTMMDKLSSLKEEFPIGRFKKTSIRSKSVARIQPVKVSHKLDEEAYYDTQYQESTLSFIESGTFRVFTNRFENNAIKKVKSDARLRKRVI